MTRDEGTSLLSNESSTGYQTLVDEWNVEIDVKGQVKTGSEIIDEEEESARTFSFKKLLQYTGPGKA
jgi:hypothetical protein